MKKINLKYFLCLLFGGILLYATLSVFTFYQIAITNFEAKEILLVLLPLLYAILTLDIFKWISKKDFELLKAEENEATKESEEIEKSKENKSNKIKKYRYFFGVFLVYIIIFGIVNWSRMTLEINNIKTSSKLLYGIASFSMSAEDLFELQEENNFNNIPKDYTGWIKSIIYSSLTFILYFLIFIKKNFGKKLKILKKPWRFLETILVFGALAISIYHFVDIPAFRYVYEVNDTEIKNTFGDVIKKEGVIFKGYSDNRDYYKGQPMIVPEKINNNRVVHVDDTMYIFNEEMFLPSTLDAEEINGMYSMFCNVHMYGEPKEWYEEDGVIYNMDGTKILYINTEDIYISEKVNEIEDRMLSFSGFLNSITVSPDNKIFSTHDNVIYRFTEYEFDEGNRTYTIGFLLGKNEDNEIIIPTSIKSDTFGIVALKELILVIPKELNDIVDFEIMKMVSEYKVESGNVCYEAYEGSLYEKGLEKMIAFRNYNEDETEIKLPAEIQEFSDNSLHKISDMLEDNENLKIVMDPNNQNFIVEDDLIYNKDKTKLIMPTVYMEKILINDNVQELSEALLYSGMEFELSPGNQYFYLDEYGDLIKK